MRHRSSATPLAWAYVALIVYASLYPFSGWRWPGVPLNSFLWLPLPRYWTGFDLVSNLLGYLPLGALVFGALVRSGGRAGAAFVLACALCAGLSLGMELLQNFLPRRVASNLDLALNAAGAALGALVGWAVHATGWVDRWQSMRDRWFIDRSAGGIALLLLWPVGLLFPLPVPLGTGQVLPRLADWADQAAQDTPLADLTTGWTERDTTPLAPGGEFSATALGLLAPCLVAFAISRGRWRRLPLVAGALALAVGATTLSTALNFGPTHALAWLTPLAPGALAVGTALALLLSAVPRRVAAALGLMTLAMLVALVAQAPADAYFADSLQAWEQGRFIRFHGVAQWVGWLWPYAAMSYLLARVGARDAS